MDKINITAVQHYIERLARRDNIFLEFDNLETVEYLTEEMQKVFCSPYKGSTNKRIAHCCVNIVLRHQLANGNKRAALLALAILFHHNYGILDTMQLDWVYLYKFIKKTATKGAHGKDRQIEELASYLKFVAG